MTDQLTLQIQDPILNETGSLLAQSMRETHDELTRDMLEAGAAQIDCVNGTNGRPRQIAVVKPSIIDLELLAA